MGSRSDPARFSGIRYRANQKSWAKNTCPKNTLLLTNLRRKAAAIIGRIHCFGRADPAGKSVTTDTFLNANAAGAARPSPTRPNFHEIVAGRPYVAKFRYLRCRGLPVDVRALDQGRKLRFSRLIRAEAQRQRPDTRAPSSPASLFVAAPVDLPPDLGSGHADG